MRLHFDAAPQVRAGLNMIYTALLATVYYAVKSLVDPEHAAECRAGPAAHRDRDAGLVVSCVSSGRGEWPVQHVPAGGGPDPRRAGAGAAGSRHCGDERANTAALFDGRIHPDGSPWIYLETIGGGSGARAGKDGLDGVQVHMTNTSNLPLEALETEYPLTLVRYELVDGSGGPGRFRGGMGLRRVYRAEVECRLRVDGSRLRSSPWGLSGGSPGARAVFDFGGSIEERGVVTLRPGQLVELVTAGGGGYGAPARRDPDAIRRDVAEHRISAEEAREIYGLA